jgi:hypothetical protein
MLPFLGFNAWAMGTESGRGMFTKLMLMDVVGNLLWVGGSLAAISQLPEEEADKAE